MTAENGADPDDWLLSEDPGPYSRYADEHSDETLPSADPGWPPQVRDAWESFRQARAKVSALLDALDQLEEEQAASRSLTVIMHHVYYAEREGNIAYNAYIEEWYSWQPQPDQSFDYEGPEAGG